MDTTKQEIAKLLISKKQAAQATSLSVRSIEYAIARGDIESRVIGRRRLVVYRSLVHFAGRDHPELSGNGASVQASTAL
jgi:hypothetical protein